MRGEMLIKVIWVGQDKEDKFIQHNAWGDADQDQLGRARQEGEMDLTMTE
jgi:hypothetical protein